MGSPVIELDIESAYYIAGNPVFEGFRMNVEQGEIVAVTGPSGCGKSTLLKIIAGLHKNYIGRSMLGQGAQIALIPQKHSLLPWKTVYQNIISLRMAAKRSVDQSKAQALIDSIGLSGFERQYPGRLSGGQYQRAALGQAVMYEPDVLLMDEPFTNLDLITKRGVQDIFQRLRRNAGMTTVLVTHDMEDARYLGCRVVELRA